MHSLHVGLQVVRICKCFVADVACKLGLSSVNFHVNLEVVFFRKAFPTYRTFVGLLSYLFLSVYFSLAFFFLLLLSFGFYTFRMVIVDMSVQILLILKSFSTVTALKRLVTIFTVNSFCVIDQHALLVEPLPTFVTKELESFRVF